MNLIVLQALVEGLKSFLPLILIVIVFYMFFIRPQSKQKKEMENLIDNLKKGDRVITAGGIHGKVLKDNGTNLVIEIDNHTKIKVEKSSISLELTKKVQEDTKEVAEKK